MAYPEKKILWIFSWQFCYNLRHLLARLCPWCPEVDKGNTVKVLRKEALEMRRVANIMKIWYHLWSRKIKPVVDYDLIASFGPLRWVLSQPMILQFRVCSRIVILYWTHQCRISFLAVSSGTEEFRASQPVLSLYSVWSVSVIPLIRFPQCLSYLL